MLKRKDLTGRVKPGARSAEDPVFQKSYPTLWSYLTQTKWDDGEPRQTATVFLLYEDGTFKAVLNDRDLGVCCWVAMPSLSDFWEVLEAAVSDPDQEWRTDRKATGVSKRVSSEGEKVDRKKGKR